MKKGAKETGQETLWEAVGVALYRKRDQRALRAAGLRRCHRCHQIKPLAEFHCRARRVVNGKDYGPYHEARCKPCDVIYTREWRQRNPMRHRGQRQAWLKKQYGLALTEYDELLLIQGGRCAICREEMPKPCIDHDHETGAVRGLLCSPCNTVLGHAHDRVSVLNRAIEYLAAPPSLKASFSGADQGQKGGR